MPILPKTDTAIRRLKVPAGQAQIEYHDDKTPGLSLIIGSRRKSWCLRYRAPGGKRKRIVVGYYPKIGLATARDRVDAIIGARHDDVDPAAKRKAYLKAPTVAEAGENYLALYAANKASRQLDINIIRREVIPEIGDKKLVDVKRQDVQAVVRKVLRRGAGVMANRTLEVVRKFLAWSIEQGWIEANPAAGISKPTIERPRSRTLSDAELKDLWQALDKVSRQARACFKLLLLTGQREMEVVGMRWPEIDLERGVWTLPAHDPGRSKTRSAPHLVPLTPPAVAVLSGIRELSSAEGQNGALEPGGRRNGIPAGGFEDFVFRGRTRGDKRGGVRGGMPASPKRGILVGAKEVLDADHLTFSEPWRIHDLRRTVRTGLSQLSVQPHIAELVIGHAIGGIVKVYDRYDYLAEKREALTRWADHLLTIVGEQAEANNVVALAARA